MRTLECPSTYETLYTEGDRYHVEREGQTPYRERYDHDVGVAAVRWPKLVRELRLLDVGCANGAFVKYAAQMGVQADGLEPNVNMARWARDRTRRSIFTTWEEVEGPYDVVTLHDVFEHAADPKHLLGKIRAVLRPGGLLILDVPDAEHEEFVRAPMLSHHMKPLEHLWFWDEANLGMLLASEKFIIKTVDRPIPGKLVVYARA
jgi:2-polyprenyl-3-methyl-5-hydroxy-6-metoxy-1,4-benzoquinol methylase